MPYKRKKGGQRLMELAGTDLASRNAALKRKRARQKALRISKGMGKAIDKAKLPRKVIRHGKTKITVNGKPSPHLTSSRPTPKPTPTKPTKTSDKKKNLSRVVTEAEKKQFSKLLTKKQAERREPKGAYAKLLKADRDKKFASGAGGAKGGGTISARPSKNFLQRGPERQKATLDYLFPKHRGIGQSQTGYSRAGAGDVGLEVGKRALDAWLTVSGTKAVWGGAKQLKHAPGLAKRMKPWLTGKKPLMSKEFIKTLGGKNLKSFMEFVKRKKTFKQAFPTKAPSLSKRELKRRADKAKVTRVKTEADRLEAVAKNKAAATPKPRSAFEKPLSRTGKERPMPTGKKVKTEAPKSPAAKKKVAKKKQFKPVPTAKKAPAKKANGKKKTKGKGGKK
jgi:hypothetical protein